VKYRLSILPGSAAGKPFDYTHPTHYALLESVAETGGVADYMHRFPDRQTELLAREDVTRFALLINRGAESSNEERIEIEGC
jgi:hypothetical protein